MGKAARARAAREETPGQALPVEGTATMLRAACSRAVRRAASAARGLHGAPAASELPLLCELERTRMAHDLGAMRRVTIDRPEGIKAAAVLVPFCHVDGARVPWWLRHAAASDANSLNCPEHMVPQNICWCHIQNIWPHTAGGLATWRLCSAPDLRADSSRRFAFASAEGRIPEAHSLERLWCLCKTRRNVAPQAQAGRPCSLQFVQVTMMAPRL